jgi:hypothetical protein
MGKGFLFRAVLTRVCLVAMAIQGVTPDAQDLASPALSRVLRAITAPDGLTGLDAARGGALPPPGPGRDPSRDGMPDEVCAPVSAPSRVAVRASVEGRSHLDLPPPPPTDPSSRTGGARPAHPAGPAAGGDRLTVGLCRLTC